MTEHLWPHPTLAEKFQELIKFDEAIRKRLKAVEREVAEIANLQAELSGNAADCVLLSIMQRDNAEASRMPLGNAASERETLHEN